MRAATCRGPGSESGCAAWLKMAPPPPLAPQRNPRTWVSAQIDREGGTYWWSPGTRVDALTLLAPFRKPNGAFYNSNEVRNWTRLGYE